MHNKRRFFINTSFLSNQVNLVFILYQKFQMQSPNDVIARQYFLCLICNLQKPIDTFSIFEFWEIRNIPMFTLLMICTASNTLTMSQIRLRSVFSSLAVSSSWTSALSPYTKLMITIMLVKKCRELGIFFGTYGQMTLYIIRHS